MYPYHDVLSKHRTVVEFYVVDARRLPSGRALVQLTVLVPRYVPWPSVLNLYFELMECMHQTALHDLASDLGVESPGDRDVLFTVLVKPEAVPEP